ncbi:MAG: hypothetical protein WC756_21545 [Taibaiella sp.]|jgi:hypothetical protein
MPFYIKDPSIANQLEVELQQVAVILPDVYLDLTGESFTANVNNVSHFNFCVFHPYLDPVQATETALLQKQYYENTIRNFEKNQTSHLGKIDFQSDVFLQSNGTINGGKLNNANIHVYWINMMPQDAMLCSAQYLYHFKTNNKIWKNKEFYNLFNKKTLHSSVWSELFNYLSFASRKNTVSTPLTIYVKGTINFLFKIYIKHLTEGWQLDHRDKKILETYFANNEWKSYLYQSFKQETAGENTSDTFDLINALRLSANTQSLQNLVQNQAQEETQKSIELEYTSVPYKKSHDNEENAFEAIQQRFQKNQRLSEAIKIQTNLHREDARLETKPLKNTHENSTRTTIKKKSTNKISRQQPIHHQQEKTLVRKTPDAQADKTIWSTIKALMQWAYEHPMYAFTALFSIIVIMQIRPSRSNPEEKTDICFDHFERIGGNSNLFDANVLVILNNNSDDSHIDEPTASCLNLYKAHTLLQKNVPFGRKANCGGNECIGWDSISTERTLQEKKYLFEKAAFNNINKIYNEHAQKHSLLDLQDLLRDYLTFLKINLKKIKKQDEYHGTLTMIKHIGFFVDTEIRSLQDMEDLHKQYQEQFSPIKEPQSDNDLKMRTETMYRALYKYISPKKKLAILADVDVYNNCVEKGFHNDLGSYMLLGVKK